MKALGTKANAATSDMDFFKLTHSWVCAGDLIPTSNFKYVIGPIANEGGPGIPEKFFHQIIL
jgi:hypothetical protein